MKHPAVIKLGLTLLAFILLGSLFYQKIYLPKHTFSTQSPQRGDLKVTVFGIGQLSAKNIYALGSPTGGKLMSVLVEEGDWVKSGQLLACLDPVDLPQQLLAAQKAVEHAKLEKQTLQTELQGLQAQAALAQATYERYQKLQNKGYAAQEKYDQSKANLLEIQSQIEATKVKIQAAQTAIEQAQHQTQALQDKLARLKITSPVAGLIIAKDAQPLQSVAPAHPVVQLVDPKTVWVKAWVDERLSKHIQVGQAAKITLRSQTHTLLAGKVARIGTQSDPITQEREVDIAFNQLPIPFYLNEQAEVRILTQQLKNQLLIPPQFLVFQQGQPAVWVVKSGHAHLQPVMLAGRSEQQVAIAKGLHLQDKLLLPSASLHEGMKVYIETAAHD